MLLAVKRDKVGLRDRPIELGPGGEDPLYVPLVRVTFLAAAVRLLGEAAMLVGFLIPAPEARRRRADRGGDLARLQPIAIVAKDPDAETPRFSRKMLSGVSETHWRVSATKSSGESAAWTPNRLLRRAVTG